MDDNLRKGLAGVAIGIVGVVGFALSGLGLFETAEALYEYQDAPGIIPYGLSVGFVVFGLYHLRKYSTTGS